MRKGWEKKKLGEICSLINRGIAPCYTESTGIRVLNQKCIRDHSLKLDFSRWHNDQNKKVPKERFVQLGDVLVNSTGTGTLGRVAQVREDLLEPITVDTHVTIVRPYLDKFYLDFFGYAMLTIEDLIKSSGEGCGGQTELSKKILADKFELKYPKCIQEQRRIVAILDDAFERIDKAIANTEKNIANANELFESVRYSLMRGNGDNSRHLYIEDVAIDFEYGTSEKSSLSGDVAVLRMGNIQNGKINWSNLVYTSNDDDIKKLSLNYDDILFNRTNSDVHVGKTAIYKREYPAIFAGYLIRILTNKDIIVPAYLNYYLNGFEAREYGKSVMSRSVNQANINCSKLKKYPIPVPPLQIQHHIVKVLIGLEEQTHSQASLMENKLTSLRALKQSLLAAAFSGELTADFNPAALEL